MTSDVHSIRLRGPWDYQVEWAVDGAPPASGRVKMPCDWSDSLGSAFRGRVRYRRSFNRPTNLDARQSVWLVVEAVRERAEVALNGRALGSVLGDAPARFNVTTILASHNELTVLVESASNVNTHADASASERPGGLVGEVRLEIVSPGEVS